MNPYLAMAVRDAVQAFTPKLPESRDCEQCRAKKLTWLMDTTRRDGHVVKTFVCPSGHLTIVQERET
jgi:hypothetical protein